MAYIVFLKANLSSPGAVLNYISMARTWTLSLNGKANQFDTYRVSILQRGLSRVMKHIPAPVPAVSPEHLKHIVAVLDKLGSVMLPVKALLLIVYFSALRQSNLLGKHILLAEDVHASHNQLRLAIHTTKTISSGS